MTLKTKKVYKYLETNFYLVEQEPRVIRAKTASRDEFRGQTTKIYTNLYK